MEKQLKKDELVFTLTVLTRQVSDFERELERLNKMSERGEGTEFHNAHVSWTESRIRKMRDLLYRVAEAITDIEDKHINV